MEKTGLIGNTKLIDLSQWLPKAFSEGLGGPTPLDGLRTNPKVSLFAKAEHLNPTGSLKDRIVDYMVTKAEKNGYLKPGDWLIESTSGNTGAAVAMVAAQKGYRALLVIPDRVSQEKQAILKALGAVVEVMPSHASIHSALHYTRKAKDLSQTIPNAFYMNQYDSVYNKEAHYYSTGPEIWAQTKGKIDVFVSVMGSGGTISGIGQYLKNKNPNIKVVGIDPVGSVYLPYFLGEKEAECKAVNASLVEGAGSDHMTSVMDFSVVDEVIPFQDQDAFHVARYLARTEGIVAGGSSGANLWGAMQVAKKATHPLCIVTLLPDSGLKYLSKFYHDPWMESQGLSI